VQKACHVVGQSEKKMFVLQFSRSSAATTFQEAALND
jgi:hypothetical protein